MFKKGEQLLVSCKDLPFEWEHIINNYHVYFVRYLPVSLGNFVEVRVRIRDEDNLYILPRANCFHMVDNKLSLNKRMKLFMEDYIINV